MFELVAEEDGEIVGHILFSRLWADRAELYAALAPLAVRPERQNSGLRLGPGARGPGQRRASSAATACWCWATRPTTAASAFPPRPRGQVSAPYRGLAAFQALALEEAPSPAP